MFLLVCIFCLVVRLKSFFLSLVNVYKCLLVMVCMGDVKKVVPRNIRIVAFLLYAQSLISIVGGVVLLFFQYSFFVVFGVLSILWGAFIFFVSKNLLRAKSWSRIVTIVIACQVMIGYFNIPVKSLSFSGLFFAFLFAAAVFVCLYLLFSKEAKKFFS